MSLNDGSAGTVLDEVTSFLRHGLWRCFQYKNKHYPPTFTQEFENGAGETKMGAIEQVQAYKTKFSLTIDHMTSPRMLWGLCASGATIFGIGVWEGVLLTRGKSFSPAFLFNYARHQMFSSVVWATKPAETVLAAMGKRPKEFLREFDTASSSDAKTQLNIFGLQTGRSILAGFLGISQIFAMMFAFGDATDEYEQKLKKGKLVIGGNHEKIIRLSGTSSDVSACSLHRFGTSNFLPIFEDPGLVEEYVKDYSDGLTVPVFWHVPNNQYGSPSAWGASGVEKEVDKSLKAADFKIRRKWLSSVRPEAQELTERRILIVEGDSSVGEESLALSAEVENDLDVSEASLGFRMVEKIARAQRAMNQNDRVVSVLLADEEGQIVSGGGKKIYLREHISSNGVVDIVIDAKKPLLKSILIWAQETSNAMGRPDQKILYFDTYNRKYFSSVKKALANFGWTVLDGQSSAKDFICKDRYAHTPCLVYQNSTTRTVDSIRHLVAVQEVAPSSVCALLDKHMGQRELLFLEKELGFHDQKASIGYVCSSQVYDLLFQSVRLLLKSGLEPTEVQAILDKEMHISGVNA